MAMPIIRAVQAKALEQNPDVSFAFLMRPQFKSLMESLNVPGEHLGLPDKNWRYFLECRKWKGQFDAQILFTRSLRSDLEAKMIGSPHRYSVVRHGDYRPFINHPYSLDASFDFEGTHQTRLWESFGKDQGLLDEISLAPEAHAPSTAKRIGLICGSANSPEKRWPVAYWQNLVNELSDRVDEIILLGTADDLDICNEVSGAATQSSKVTNLAGKTNLPQLVEEMRSESLIIGNDTGGLHLANLLGVSAIGLFGPTNPVRTSPVHDAPLYLLKSEAEPGQRKMSDISVERVCKTVDELLG